LALEIKEKILKLENSFGTGNVIKNGIPVSIIGETNAGKSTLLNFLLKEDKAIVSDIHGTTRDVVEDTITINGLLFRFIDTAGLRETTDVIENMGIERSFKEMEKASVVLWVVDASQPLENMKKIASQIEPRLVDQKCVIVFNKMDAYRWTEKDADDLTPAGKENVSLDDLMNTWMSRVGDDCIFISARQKTNIEELKELLYKRVRELHVQKYPYNNFLFQQYNAEGEAE
jgi:tRNA modification GTPase